MADREVVDRYVEVSYRLADDEAQFRALVLRTATPNEAAEKAVADTRRMHPQATDVAEFMQRALTPERAAEIRAAFANGTWEGWPLG